MDRAIDKWAEGLITEQLGGWKDGWMTRLERTNWETSRQTKMNKHNEPIYGTAEICSTFKLLLVFLFLIHIFIFKVLQIINRWLQALTEKDANNHKKNTNKNTCRHTYTHIGQYQFTQAGVVVFFKRHFMKWHFIFFSVRHGFFPH